MKSSKAALTALLFSALVAGAASGVAAEGKKDKKNEHNVVREALQRGEVLPLVKILAIAGQHVPGDVVEVELEQEKIGLIYEIKILTETGRVREIKIDARTGKVLTIEDD